MRARIAYTAALVLGVLVFGGFAGDALAGQLELLTTGPTAGHPPYAYYGNSMMSADARHVFFETREKLVAQDQDGNCLDYTADDPPLAPRIDCLDVYERFGAQTRLVSFGGNGPYDTRLLGVSSDGTRAFFGTAESLLANDTNNVYDVYEWSDGSLQLVPGGPRYGSRWAGASEDGSTVFVNTGERVTPNDQSECGGIYARSGGQTTRFSAAPGINPDNACHASPIWDGFRDHVISSPNGSHYFFYSDRPLVAMSGRPHDIDLYEWTSDGTRLVSTGPDSGTRTPPGGPFDARFITAAPDGSRVFFDINDPLVPGDTGGDTSFDIYERDSSGVHLFAPPEVRANPTNLSASPLATSYDGSRVFVWTNARLAPDDTNSDFDIYERLGGPGGSYHLVTTGPLGASTPGFIILERFKYAFSQDGTRVFFETTKRLVPEDTNNNADLYMREGDTTRLITAGTPGYSGYFSITPDGRHVLINTDQALLPGDTDTKSDIYQWDGGSLRLVDIAIPTTEDIGGGLSADASRLVLSTRQQLTPDDTDTLNDLYAFTPNRPPDCAGVLATHSSLWPPNRSLRRVELSGATDPDGDAVSLSITGVTQDEPLGRTPDAVATSDPAVVRLRAQRSAQGDGRVYHVAFTVSDGTASCSGAVAVSVPRNRHKAAVDSAPPSYDSFKP
jgi:hypothetical protein